MVRTRHELARGLVSTALKYADDVAARLSRCYREPCADEPAPDWSAIQTFAGQRVDRLRLDLLSADSRQLAADREARRLRRERDDTSRRLHRNLTLIRTVFDAAHGAGSCAITLGLVPGMSRKPAAVCRLAERAVARMRNPELAMPAPAMRLVRLDLKRLLASIEDDLETLGQALERLQECQQRLRRASQVKRTAMSRFDREIRPWMRVLEALFQLAGEDALAADLKPPKSGRAA